MADLRKSPKRAPTKKAPAQKGPAKKPIKGKRKVKKPAPKKAMRAPRRRSLYQRVTYAFFWAVLGIGLLGCVTAVLGYYYFSQDLPPLDSLKNYRPKTVTFFYSDDGQVIGEYSHERRIVVPLAKVPQHVRDAFIAAEDANFYHHPGIDIASIVRAFIRNVEAGRIVQGGSTITMQVTRTFLLTPEKKYTRKIREAILSYRIDRNLTKDEILYLYLNQIYLGHGAHGIESAAELYFNKHVDQLSIAEGALLAGIVQRPSAYSPFNLPKEARRRQVYTIEQMVDKGFITQAQADAALAEELQFYDRPNVNTTVTPYFTEHVRRLLEKEFGEESLYNDGFKVYTTVNVELQAAARRAINKGLAEFTKRRSYRGPIRQLTQAEVEVFLSQQDEELIKKPLAPEQNIEAVVAEVNAKAGSLKILFGPYTGIINKKDLRWALGKGKSLNKLLKPGDVILARFIKKDEESGEWGFSLEQEPLVQSALICLDNADGGVKAMVGGRDFNESQFNRAVQSRRQPGSSFKAVIYTAAMENGFTPDSILIDSPIVYDDFAHGRRWKPTNFDRKFYGPTNLYTGLTSSRNVMAIKLLSLVGYPAVIDMARRMGITSPLAENLSLALGSSGVSLAEMVTAFSTFPNLGERYVLRYINRIEDRDGNVIKEYRPEKIRVVEPEIASVVQHMLRGVVAHGTGARVKKLGRPVGGKTGTTNDLADAWFMGFTPEYVTGVWVGRDEMKRMGFGESGGRAAAPIFLYFMQEALKDKPVREFEVPPGVTVVRNGSQAIAYKEGTMGTGYSEVGASSAGDEFLKNEFDDSDL